MFFSKIAPREDIAQQKLSKLINQNVYKLHQTIWRLFHNHHNEQDKLAQQSQQDLQPQQQSPQQQSPQQETRSFIYRHDDVQSLPCFYAVSHTAPCDVDGIWKIATKPYAPKIQSQQQFSFILRVNPRVAKFDIQKNKRYDCDVIMDAYKKSGLGSEAKPALIQQTGREWLEQRAKKHGFIVKNVVVEAYQQHCLYKKNHNNIRFSTVDYRGCLQVVDAELFLRVLFQGIGAAKGFGCGLLMIKR